MKPLNQQIPVNDSERYCGAGIKGYQLLTSVSAWKLSFFSPLLNLLLEARKQSDHQYVMLGMQKISMQPSARLLA